MRDDDSIQASGGDPPSACPRCDAVTVRVVEDVSDEVTVFGCTECGATWAQRHDH